MATLPTPAPSQGSVVETELASLGLEQFLKLPNSMGPRREISPKHAGAWPKLPKQLGDGIIQTEVG